MSVDEYMQMQEALTDPSNQLGRKDQSTPMVSCLRCSFLSDRHQDSSTPCQKVTLSCKAADLHTEGSGSGAGTGDSGVGDASVSGVGEVTVSGTGDQGVSGVGAGVTGSGVAGSTEGV